MLYIGMIPYFNKTGKHAQLIFWENNYLVPVSYRSNSRSKITHDMDKKVDTCIEFMCSNWSEGKSQLPIIT